MNGKVFDANTLGPLEFANVYFKNDAGTMIGTTTDAAGLFALPGAAGRVCFVSYVGYLGKAFTGTDGFLSIGLSPSTEELPEVVIYPDPPRPASTSFSPLLGLLLVAAIGYALSDD